MSDLSKAFELMGVGMITVFIILSLVVVVGNLIIRIVNKYIPEEITSITKKVTAPVKDLNKKKIAAIVTAVNTLTSGQGRVTKVEKI